MKKLYNFRLEPNLIKELDMLDGTRTRNVTDALHSYLHSDTLNSYDVNLIDLLKSQVIDLQARNNRLENKCEFYHIQSMSWLKRRSYLKHVALLPVAVSGSNPDVMDL